MVRLGIDHPVHSLPDSIDWPAIQALARKQGLLAVLLDGIDKMRNTGGGVDSISFPQRDFLTRWIGEVLQNYEARYSAYQRAISKLADFYSAHGFRMMVLKGYACGLNWPKPNHRPCGDIDIWQFGQYKDADAVLSTHYGIEIDKSHHHHTVFEWNGFTVENHYDLINVHHHKSNADLEKVLKELAADYSCCVDVEGMRVYVPSPNLHTLFLLRHAAAHFASTYITLRHVLDWAFFVEANNTAIDWSWLTEVVTRFGLLQFMKIITAICVEDLGFDRGIFPLRIDEYSGNKEEDQKSSQISEGFRLKVRVLADILSPEFTEIEPSSLLPRIFFKYRRWRANSWKHRLVYSDSVWSAFWTGAWSHIIKPSSI